MKFQEIAPKSRIFLAPMEGINDIAFRKLCKDSGAGIVFTGMIHPETKQNLDLEDNSAIQIFTRSTKGIKEFIKKHEKKAVLFDLNLGCPAKLAKKMQIGSFMLNKNDLSLIEEILKTMRDSTEKPITVKLRKSKHTLKIVKIAEKYCDAIIIHPRTQAQGYSGIPDYKFALNIKSHTKLPVIYSGNANEIDLKKILKDFDYIMIGRAAIGNPEIFQKLNNQLNKTKEPTKKITYEDWKKIAKEYKFPFSQYKLQAMNFTKGIKSAKELRNKLIFAKSIREIDQMFKEKQNK